MSTFSPYNKGMNGEMIERSIRTYQEEKRRARNEALLERLASGKTFEDMLFELASLKGFNAKERELARKNRELALA